MNHQNDGEESSEGRSSVAAARSTLEQRPEAVRVAVQTLKADAELSLRVANAETRISVFGTFGTGSERTGVDPGGGRSC